MAGLQFCLELRLWRGLEFSLELKFGVYWGVDIYIFIYIGVFGYIGGT